MIFWLGAALITGKTRSASQNLNEFAQRKVQDRLFRNLVLIQQIQHPSKTHENSACLIWHRHHPEITSLLTALMLDGHVESLTIKQLTDGRYTYLTK